MLSIFFIYLMAVINSANSWYTNADLSNLLLIQKYLRFNQHERFLYQGKSQYSYLRKLTKCESNFHSPSINNVFSKFGSLQKKKKKTFLLHLQKTMKKSFTFRHTFSTIIRTV